MLFERKRKCHRHFRFFIFPTRKETSCTLLL